jgi:hypothetical protein
MTSIGLPDEVEPLPKLIERRKAKQLSIVCGNPTTRQSDTRRVKGSRKAGGLAIKISRALASQRGQATLPDLRGSGT